MRPGVALVLALLFALPGCFTPDADRVTLIRANRLFSGPTGDDVVGLSIAVVERPVGDALLNHELWEFINEQVLDSDTRLVLSQNGIRVGRVGGSPPSALQALISSERSCGVAPRAIQMHAGNPTPVTLAPEWSQCRFQQVKDGSATRFEMARATCQLQIVPRLSENGPVTLRFTPFVKHGDLKQKPVAVRTPSGELQWELQVAQDEETFTDLAWEVTVDANDTLVIGTRPEFADTLGHRTFIQTETAKPVQRLLVLRVGRVLPEPDVKPASNREGVPLAIQAGLPE